MLARRAQLDSRRFHLTVLRDRQPKGQQQESYELKDFFQAGDDVRVGTEWINCKVSVDKKTNLLSDFRLNG